MISRQTQKGKDARDKILAAAAHLFQQLGYAATSIRLIISTSGQPKGSLYFHFPGGKQEMALAAATQSSAFIIALIDDIFITAPNTLTAITSICGAFTQQLKASGYRDGCPISPLATSATNETSPLRQSCASSYDQWLSAIKAGLKSHGIAEARSASLASLVLSSVEGAVLLSQVRHNTEALDLLPASLAPLLENDGSQR